MWKPGDDLLSDPPHESQGWYSVFDVDAEGYMALPTAPGLGIAVNEAKVREAAAAGHKWKDREWTLPDGCPTTW